MGSPINTNHDDFALIYDKETDLGFFCSNRSGMGDDDIFTYKHIYVEQTIVAGTLKAGIPNISLVGERVAIKNLTTGKTTYQRLDEFERFEFSALAGEQVAVYMMNGEYFDENTPAATYYSCGYILSSFKHQRPLCQHRDKLSCSHKSAIASRQVNASRR